MAIAARDKSAIANCRRASESNSAKRNCRRSCQLPGLISPILSQSSMIRPPLLEALVLERLGVIADAQGIGRVGHRLLESHAARELHLREGLRQRNGFGFGQIEGHLMIVGRGKRRVHGAGWIPGSGSSGSDLSA